jgi:hypothetical protein
VILREADLNKLALEVSKRGYLGVAQVPFVFNWNELVSLALKALYSANGDEACADAANSLASKLGNWSLPFAPAIDAFRVGCETAANSAISAASSGLRSLFLPISQSQPVPLFIQVKTLVFDFQASGKVIMTAGISIQITTEVASFNVVVDATPALDDPKSLLTFRSKDDNTLGLSLCLNNLAFNINSFNLAYNNPYLKKEAEKIVNQQLTLARQQAAASDFSYCTDLIREVTPPAKMYGQAIRAMNPHILVKADQLIIESQVKSTTAQLPAILQVLLQ